jgi:hypothetical protein
MQLGINSFMVGKTYSGKRRLELINVREVRIKTFLRQPYPHNKPAAE